MTLERLQVGSVYVALAMALACGGKGSPATPATPEGPSNVAHRGSRRLSIDVTEGQDGDFGRAFEAALGAGMDATSLSLPWDEIEHAPGEYANPFPSIANAFYPSHGVSLSLTLSVIDTNNTRVPGDLAGRPFDDPEVIGRFNGAMDWVLAEMPDVRLDVLAIGNEIDGTLRTPDDWARYRRFLEATAAHARARRPGLRVGSKAMFGGLTGLAQAELQALNTVTDVVLATYYPLEGDFAPRDLSVVRGDLDRLVALYPGRPLMLLEAGYPSGDLCGGSDDRQAAFVREVFGWWDAHRTDVEMITFTWLTDIPESEVIRYGGYYGVDLQCFAEYLRTLGLRTSASADKPAFVELKSQAAARGWTTRP